MEKDKKLLRIPYILHSVYNKGKGYEYIMSKIQMSRMSRTGKMLRV